MTENRPEFPKRAVVTAGMPYGNKELHLGHIGGVFIHADTFARFLRDRIGKENVIFVSGTDCYGSPIFEHYRKLVGSGAFEGTIDDFVRLNHSKQKEVLDFYHVDINLFAASSFGPAAGIHREVSSNFIRRLYENGHLVKMTTSQFYDTELGVFLNGRQVVGQCPIAGCTSERGYADECSLGHQYMPVELLNPKSTITGKKPEMRDVTNWYLKLDSFHSLLSQWVKELEEHPASRNFVQKSIREFLEPPVIYLKRDQLDLVNAIKDSLPEYSLRDEENKTSVTLVFDSLEKREKACGAFAANSIRYCTGKTLVPFRLTGNIEWGVPAPALEGLENLTVWVWPESLWAPISFTMACLELQKKDISTWKDWWCSKDSKVYQFMGEDNVYFYGPAEMAIFMGTQGKDPSVDPPEGELQLPELIVNNHILFLDKKASSSDILAESRNAILEYEKLMYKCDFHQVMNLMDTYIRSINKYWSKNIREAEADNDMKLHKQVLVDTFHMVRTAVVLMHPIAPVGTEMVLEYLDLGEEFWNWDNIFEPVYAFMNNPAEHKLKFLEPRVDFFKKHPSQIKE
ncbi:MAG: class I tRNA ligase family protein [Caulobacteraceae bacterium]